MPVALRIHADRRDTEAEQAGIISCQPGFDLREVREIVVQDFMKLRVLHAGRAAPDRQYFRDARIDEALAQHALPDHAGGAKQDDFHDRMNASWSALRVAASVVGMPCGKPL